MSKEIKLESNTIKGAMLISPATKWEPSISAANCIQVWVAKEPGKSISFDLALPLIKDSIFEKEGIRIQVKAGQKGAEFHYWIEDEYRGFCPLAASAQ